MHLTGFCFLLASPSWQAQRIPAALQGECLGPLSPSRYLYTSDSGLQWSQRHPKVDKKEGCRRKIYWMVLWFQTWAGGVITCFHTCPITVPPQDLS